MLLNKIISINKGVLLNCCFFHTSQYNAGISKTMKKIMTGTNRKRRIYSDEAIVPIASTFTKDLFKKKNPENNRRISVLNKLFMTHITDLMSTGEYSSQLAGYGIEINRIKVTPDYHYVNVYWIARESADDTEIEKLLEPLSGLLRHELSQLYVMGAVPRITFIKDKEYARFVEVDKRLAEADFGDDYEKSDASLKMKSYLQLQTPLHPEIREKITSLEKSENITTEEEIPEMPQNVLGVNHSDIMNRIKKSIKKSQASHRSEKINEDAVVHPFNPDPIEFKSTRAQREAFQQFLIQRQILRNRTRKLMKHYRPDWDYLEEESLLLKEHQIDSIKFDDFDEKDYIDEDYENENRNER